MNTGVYLEMSPAHIEQADDRLLTAWADITPSHVLYAKRFLRGKQNLDDNTPSSPLRVVAHDFGHMLRVPADPESFADDLIEIFKAGASVALIALLTLARDQGADWLILDADAPTTPGLPTYAWAEEGETR